jgi:hypothetical protein
MTLKQLCSRFLALLAIAVLAGCATPPSADQMKAQIAGFELPKKPDPGKAMVYVVRPSGLGGLIRFNVFVDDQEAASEMGFTRGSQYIYFHVTPGEHKIFSKAENWADVTISANAGDIVFVHQDPSMGILMARNSVAKIEEVEGKYYVKTLTPGTIIKTDK